MSGNRLWVCAFPVVLEHVWCLRSFIGWGVGTCAVFILHWMLVVAGCDLGGCILVIVSCIFCSGLPWFSMLYCLMWRRECCFIYCFFGAGKICSRGKF